MNHVAPLSQSEVTELQLALGLLFGALSTLPPNGRNLLLAGLLIGTGAYFLSRVR